MNYWAERQARIQEELTDKSIAETEEQLARYYLKAQKKVIREFEDTYNKLLNTVAEGRAPTPADLYKLDTYWQMEGQLHKELRLLGDKQTALLNRKFLSQYTQIYEAIALKDDFGFGKIDKSIAQQLINEIWCADGKSWSSRVWHNTELLQNTLNDKLLECVITGKKPTELRSLLQKEFGVSFSRADSLVRTEMAHIQTQAAKQRYVDAGLQQVEVWATKDERRCDVCGELHQKKYFIHEQMPIPAHPRCRCCILPVLD